jgi:hypothetical protein
MIQSCLLQTSVLGSETGHTLDGSLRVQLLTVQGIHLGSKDTAWSSGIAYVVMTCNDWAGHQESYTSDTVKITQGNASFEDGPIGAVPSTRSATLGATTAFTFSRVSPGVMSMWLVRKSALGQRIIAKASLQLNAVRHQLDGGLDMEHEVQWQALNRKQTGSRGSVTLQACWVSTEQEQQELQLLQMQVCAQGLSGRPITAVDTTVELRTLCLITMQVLTKAVVLDSG